MEPKTLYYVCPTIFQDEYQLTRFILIKETALTLLGNAIDLKYPGEKRVKKEDGLVFETKAEALVKLERLVNEAVERRLRHIEAIKQRLEDGKAVS